MKSLIISLLVMLLVLPFAFCQSKRKAKDADQAQINQNNSVRSAVISFASAGSGIDVDTYGKLKQYLNQQQLKYTEKAMGREGEVEVTVDLSGRNPEEVKKITDYLKSLHQPEKLVRVEIK